MLFTHHRLDAQQTQPHSWTGSTCNMPPANLCTAGIDQSPRKWGMTVNAAIPEKRNNARSKAISGRALPGTTGGGIVPLPP